MQGADYLFPLLIVGLVFFINTHAFGLRKIKILLHEMAFLYYPHGLGLVETGSGHSLSHQTRSSLHILLHQLRRQPETGSHTPPRSGPSGYSCPASSAPCTAHPYIYTHTPHALQISSRATTPSVTDRSAEASAVVTSQAPQHGR